MAIDIPEELILGTRDRDNCCFVSWQETPTKINSEKSFNSWSQNRITISNEFRNGFKISTEKRGGQSADFAKIVFPEGYVFELNMGNLLDIISKTNIINGEIQGKCAISKNRTLVTEEEFSKKDIEFTEDKDLEIGRSYLKICNKTGKELYKFVYLGTISKINLANYITPTVLFEKSIIYIQKEKESVSSKREVKQYVLLQKFSKTKDLNVLIEDIAISEYEEILHPKEGKYSTNIPVLDINGNFCYKKLSLENVVLKVREKSLSLSDEYSYSTVLINKRLSNFYIRGFESSNFDSNGTFKSVRKHQTFSSSSSLNSQKIRSIQQNIPLSEAMVEERVADIFTIESELLSVKNNIVIEGIESFYFLSLVAPAE